MTQVRNIVILGASCGGLGVAHYLSKHVLPQLQQSKEAKYQLHLVDPSTHFWWHVAAPREIVDVKSMPHSKYFHPIADGFNQYGNLKDSIVFHQGSATDLDITTRSVTISLSQGGTQSIEYYALVLATGVKSPTPLTTLHGDHTVSIRALEEMNTRIASAKNIVISGGGPVGVETAGEIGVRVKGKAKVTLIAGSNKLLPVLSEARAKKAENLLAKAGVTVIYGVKTIGAKDAANGKTEVLLDNGKSMTTDAYIPAYGITPNTDYAPEQLRSSKGYIKTNPQTLRVDAAGQRVYAAGDVAGVDAGGVLNMFSSLAVLNNNIALDLLATSKAGTRAEKSYNFKPAETQLVPVGPKMGVAAFNGWSMPGFMVSMFKGKDYMASEIANFTQGTKFVKA